MTGEGRFRTIADNVTLYFSLAQRINHAAVCGSIRRWIERHRFAEPILFTFLPTQFTLDPKDVIDPSLSVFYCTDKLSETYPLPVPGVGATEIREIENEGSLIFHTMANPRRISLSRVLGILFACRCFGVSSTSLRREVLEDPKKPGAARKAIVAPIRQRC